VRTPPPGAPRGPKPGFPAGGPRLAVSLPFMHELGVAASILDCVHAEAKRRPGSHISKVGIRLGEISGVDADSLQFGFECLVKETDLEPLVLEIEAVPRMQRCSQCSHEFRMTGYDPQCPQCGEFMTQCISGDQLDISYMEVDE